MKDVQIKSLAIPEIKVVRFGRYRDERGYFTEPFRESDIKVFTDSERIVQTNESFSAAGVIRGLHFQWNPYMGKLVRTVSGHMVDIIVDIRVGSPTFGRGIMYDMPSDRQSEYAECVWLPPGFAHGSYFKADSLIEYYCTGEYSAGCEAGISPAALDIDWSLCDENLKKDFDKLLKEGAIWSDKDKNGLSLQTWAIDPRAKNFIYDQSK